MLWNWNYLARRFSLDLRCQRRAHTIFFFFKPKVHLSSHSGAAGVDCPVSCKSAAALSADIYFNAASHHRCRSLAGKISERTWSWWLYRCKNSPATGSFSQKLTLFFFFLVASACWQESKRKRKAGGNEDLATETHDLPPEGGAVSRQSTPWAANEFKGFETKLKCFTLIFFVQ